MSVHDELALAQRALDELTRSVGRLERHVGASLDLRRVRSDAERLRESLAVLGEHTVPAAGRAHVPPPAGMVTVPDTPYDTSLWTDAEEEGLGARDRHAP